MLVATIRVNGSFISKKTFGHEQKPEIGPPSKREDRSSPILVYDYAVGGHNVSGVKNQVETQFIPHVGRKPEWAPWAPENTLFGE